MSRKRPQTSKRRRKEPRAHCWMCGAVKYQKFMHRVAGKRYPGAWECNDLAKCASRGANYGDGSGAASAVGG